MNSLRRWLRPLTPLYAAGMALERRADRVLGRRPRALRSPVISVGSLSAGGAGKTPVVLLLAEMLRRREYAVRILTRGYGRRGREVEQVVLGEDASADAARFGDEPVLLARRSRVPVVVGSDRYRAGLLAEEMHGAEGKTPTVVHLLDDGFQHRRLWRDADVVLVTERDLRDTLLPGGNLREPLQALCRADVLVLREEEAEIVRPEMETLLRAAAREGDGSQEKHRRDQGMPPVWMVRRSVRVVPELGGPEERASIKNAPRHDKPTVLGFCGIARPDDFRRMLEGAGVHLVGMEEFPDHHRYRERDTERLLREARTCGAEAFITTDKDAVKLTAAMRRRLEEVCRLHVAELDATLVDERAAMEDLIGLVGRLDRRRRRAAQL